MRVRLGVVLLGLRPSLRWLRGSLTFVVRQLHRYYGAVRLLQNVHVRIMGLSPSRTGLLAQTLWRSPGSRAHCLLTCLDSSTTPSPAATRDLTRLADVAFPLTEKGRHPVACFRSSMIPPASPLSTLRYDPSRDHRQDSRPEWSRFSFSVGLSHPLQCAGLSRRSLSPKGPRKVRRIASRPELIDLEVGNSDRWPFCVGPEFPENGNLGN